jgi:hypothetical protein
VTSPWAFNRSIAGQKLEAHAGDGSAQQPRHVHLGEADPGGNLILTQVRKEPQQHHFALNLGQLRKQLRH